MTFVQRVLRDFMPKPHLTKQRVLDAAETAGAPRNVIKDDTERWRFYPTVHNSKQRGQQMGLNNSVPSAVVVDGDKQSIPIQPTAERIKLVVESLDQGEKALISRPQ
jgi:hypothetical protein